MTQAPARGQGMLVVDLDHDRATLLPPRELDLASEVWLAQTLEHVATLATADVIVDLSGVRFVDHRCTAVLAAWAQTLRRSGRRLDLRLPPGSLRLAAQYRGVEDDLGLPAPSRADA